MRRWIAHAAKLYPGVWRARYGVEFDALVEDVEADWRQLANVLGGAMRMQMRVLSWWKVVAGTAVLGVFVAGILALREPARYASTAQMRLTSPPGDNLGLRRMAAIEQEVMSDSSLKRLIKDPSLNLYEADRRVSTEAAIAHMRRDVRLWREPDVAGRQWTFGVEFQYPERAKAQAVTQALVAKFVEKNLSENAWNNRYWQQLWSPGIPNLAPGKHPPTIPKGRLAPQPAPPGQTLAVLSPPALPYRSYASGMKFAGWGLFAGLLAGTWIAAALRWTRPVLQITTCALAGCAIAIGVSQLLTPRRFTSTTPLVIKPPVDPALLRAMGRELTWKERLVQLQIRALSDQHLAKIAWMFDLYPQERKSASQETIAAMFRRDIQIRIRGSATGEPSALELSYTATEPRLAQSISGHLAATFIEQSLKEDQYWATSQPAEVRDVVIPIYIRQLGGRVQIMETPSTQPVGPDRAAAAAVGTGVGLLIGGVFFYLSRRAGPPGIDALSLTRETNEATSAAPGVSESGSDNAQHPNGPTRYGRQCRA